MIKRRIPTNKPHYRFQDAWELENSTVKELIEALKKLDPKAKVYYPHDHEAWAGCEIDSVVILSKDKDIIEFGEEGVKKGSILLTEL